MFPPPTILLLCALPPGTPGTKKVVGRAQDITSSWIFFFQLWWRTTSMNPILNWSTYRSTLCVIWWRFHLSWLSFLSATLRKHFFCSHINVWSLPWHTALPNPTKSHVVKLIKNTHTIKFILQPKQLDYNLLGIKAWEELMIVMTRSIMHDKFITECVQRGLYLCWMLPLLDLSSVIMSFSVLDMTSLVVGSFGRQFKRPRANCPVALQAVMMSMILESQ